MKKAAPSSGKALLFVDTNIYLEFYRVIAGRKLLESLDAQKAHLFVTSQIVDEVQRNKLDVAVLFLVEQFKKLELPKLSVPDHLLRIENRTVAPLREQIADLNAQVAKVRTSIKQTVGAALDEISRSEDFVSRSLSNLFTKAVKPTATELENARLRKEKGNPPGKPADPLGDQITWEQLLRTCKGVSKLWIVTKDHDYFAKANEAIYLNPYLYRELMDVSSSSIDVYLFDDLLKAIRDFSSQVPVKTESLPTEQEAQEIEAEQEVVRRATTGVGMENVGQLFEGLEHWKELGQDVAEPKASLAQRAKQFLKGMSGKSASEDD